MIRLIFLLLLTFSQLNLNAQSYRVQNSIKYFQNNQLDSALYQINFALKHARTSMYAKTWYQYFLINQKYLSLANLSESDSSNYLNLMMEAYKNCKIYDTKFEFLPTLTTTIDSLTVIFEKRAKRSFNNYRLTNFTKNQGIYISFLEATGKPYLVENYQLAEAHHDLDNYDQAITYFQKSIEFNYESENAYIELMEVYLDMGRQDLVDSLYEKAIIEYPKSTKLIFIEIGQFIAKKLYYRARVMLLEALEAYQNIPDLYLMLGEVNDKLDRPEEAQEAYRTCARMAGSNYDICFQVGQYFLKCGQEKDNIDLIKEAKTYLEKSEILYDQDTMLLIGLKDIYLKIDDQDNYQRILKKLHK